MSASNPEKRQEKADLEAVVRYVKNDLFTKVKFLYDPKADLAVGGIIYSHYKEKCKNVLVGNRGLVGESRNTYMQAVWSMAMTKQMQKNALAQKRSAVYTVMQNKFGGTFLMAWPRERFVKNSLTNASVVNQICVSSV
jgi:hypothetical protein